MFYINDVVTAKETASTAWNFICFKSADIKLKPTKCEISRKCIKTLWTHFGQILSLYCSGTENSFLSYEKASNGTRNSIFFSIQHTIVLKFIPEISAQVKYLTDSTFKWICKTLPLYSFLKERPMSRPTLNLADRKRNLRYDIDASDFFTLRNFHHERTGKVEKTLRHIFYRSSVLYAAQQKNGAPKTELSAVF